MPELPEVQTVVASVRPTLRGANVDAIRVHRADVIHPAGTDLAALLKAQRVADVYRRGKKIILLLDSGDRFFIHLGMSGRLSLQEPSEPLRPHTHVVWSIGDQELRFCDPRRFGGVWWLGKTLLPDENMGPEPLEIRPAQLAKRLAKTKRGIKNVLLDQSVLAGLGNIYVDESLFGARIHPLTPADRLSLKQIAALSRSIKQTLRRALRHRGSTLRDYRDAQGKSGNFQKLHRVYKRDGKPCATCKTPIARIIIGGRSTHFCPKCQATSEL